MQSDKQKYTVEILGEVYVLVSDEGQEHVTRVRNHLDILMRDIASKIGATDIKRVAVLAALQSVSQAVRLEEKIRKIERKKGEAAARIDAVLNSL